MVMVMNVTFQTNNVRKLYNILGNLYLTKQIYDFRYITP